MPEHIDAGELRDRLEVLDLERDAEGNLAWSPKRRTWGKVTQGVLKNLFSSVGIGARDAAIVVRCQPLTLHNALRWNGTHLFLTSILPFGRNHLELHAAAVTVDTVRLRADESTQSVSFPGVLTEKYSGHEQEWPMSVNELRLVLVVPKPVRLHPGTLVEVRGAAWEVLVPHELDEYKNEYEIGRTVDL